MVLTDPSAALAVAAVLGAFNLGYWLLPERLRNGVLTAAGMLTMLLLSPAAFAAIAALILIVQLSLGESRHGSTLQGLVVVVAGFIGYKLFAAGGPLERSVSLVGFVYAVPRAVHVLIDARYRQLARPTFATLNAYFWFSPLLIIGPIHRLDEFTRGVRRRRFDAAQFGRGLERILLGLLSVKILADWIISSRLDDVIDRLDPGRDGLIALLRTVEYGLNLYFTFAGWSAVAIGLAATFGFDVAENFNRPWGQPNITEFWRSWHITLTRWTRDYVFQPIAAATRRPLPAIIATMFAIALWHEFSLRYVLWAVWHAAGLVIHRQFMTARRRGSFAWLARVPGTGRILATATTATFVMLSFTITRTDNGWDALTEFQAMLTGGY